MCGDDARRQPLAGQAVAGLPGDVAEQDVDLEVLLERLPLEERGLEGVAERADGIGEDVVEHARLRLPGACEPGAMSGNERLGLIVVAASFVVFIVWLLAARTVVRHQPNIDPGPATMDLGPEPPAVVNHIIHRRLTADAVPATLLDLAARGWAEVFAPHQGATMVRLRGIGPGDADPLTAYEQQLLDAVRQVAGTEDLPAERLAAALNPSTPWFWTRFRMSVSRDSKARGLVRRPRVARIALTADIAPFVLCVGLALIDPGLLGLGIPLLFVLWPLAWYLAIRKAPDQLTPEGRAVAARWLGVRTFVEGTGSLDDLPPAAVAVWDRYLAYGVAMDLSEEAVAGLLLHFRTDVKVADMVNVGRSLMDPNAMGGILGEQMAQAHADRLLALGAGFSAAAPFGPDAGDFCVLAAATQKGLGRGRAVHRRLPRVGARGGATCGRTARRRAAGDRERSVGDPSRARSVARHAFDGDVDASRRCRDAVV